MADGRTLIGFGASSMQGAGDAQGGWFGRAEKLANGKGGYTKWLNLGIGGNTTRDMLARADAISQMGEHDVVVMLGCNDLPRAHDPYAANRTSLGEYEQNLQRIWSKIRGSRSLLVTSFPVDVSRLGIEESQFEGYVNVATSTAQRAGFEVWDLYRQLLHGPDTPGFWAPDGLHFNDAGHAWIAQHFVSDWLVAKV